MKRLLFISHRVPYPPDKGERVRALEEIKALSQHFDVTLAALDDAPAGPDDPREKALRKWCSRVIFAPHARPAALARGALRLLGGGCVTEGFFAHCRLARTLKELTQRQPFDLVMGYSSGVLGLVLRAEAAVRIMDLVDVDSAKWRSYAATSSWPRRWLFRREAEGVEAIERCALQQCQAVTLVSQAEASLLGEGHDNLHVIGNGVDVTYFQRDSSSPPERCPSLVFTGTMNYRPNAEGIAWFVQEVWPGLRQRFADLTLNIVGRDPTPTVRKLSRYEGVNVTGSVPDVRPYLQSALAAVVPLRIARGVQNKVLEAMSMSLPVVGSPEALEGLDVRIGTDVLEAQTPQEWQRQIQWLLLDTHRRWAMGHAARLCVMEHYRWEAQMQRLVTLCETLLDASEPATRRGET